MMERVRSATNDYMETVQECLTSIDAGIGEVARVSGFNPERAVKLGRRYGQP